MRENLGEIDLARDHALPQLITQADLQGDVHMHTVETDGRNTIEEMAEAAKARGYKYMAITDHSKNLAFANGLDDAARRRPHPAHSRSRTNKSKASRSSPASKSTSWPTATSISPTTCSRKWTSSSPASTPSSIRNPAKMTDRLLKAIANPNTSLIGHPTGRIQLRRDAYAFDMHAVLAAAAKHKVAMELNSYPDRLDLNDVHLRQAKQQGVKIVINTDSHHTSHMEKIRYGVLQARRAWLTQDDVLNTLPAPQFAKAMKHAW